MKNKLYKQQNHETKDYFTYNVMDDLKKKSNNRQEVDGNSLTFGVTGTSKCDLFQNMMCDSLRRDEYYHDLRPIHVLRFNSNFSSWNYYHKHIEYAFCEQNGNEHSEMNVRLSDCVHSVVILDGYNEFLSNVKSERKCELFSASFEHLKDISKKCDIDFILTSSSDLPSDEWNQICDYVNNSGYPYIRVFTYEKRKQLIARLNHEL